MKNNGFVFGLTVAAVLVALAFAGCDTGTVDDTVTGGNIGTDVPSYANSVQEKINKETEVTKNPSAASGGKLISAAYNTDGSYTLLYKIGRIDGLFSNYVTNGIPGGEVYGIAYTTNVSAAYSASFNTTVSSSVSAGVSVESPILKSSVECTVGVSISETISVQQAVGSGTTYSYNFAKFDSDKLYAFAMFSMMDFYQTFTYNPNNNTAIPATENGKPVVYYDILNMFSYQICEYIPVEEIKFKTLDAWDSFNPVFSDEDRAKLNSAEENGDEEQPADMKTLSTVYVYDGDSLKIDDNTGHVHTNNRPIELDIAKLKALGYKNIKITMDVEIRAHDTGAGRAIWLDIDNAKVWKISNLNVTWKSWEQRTYTQTVAIASFKDTSVFRFGFENDTKDFWTDKIWWFNRATVTFSALK
jgi:hypothetical protein